MRLAILALLVACGSKTPPAPAVTSNAAPDAGVVTAAAGCPAAWSDMVPGSACDPAVVTHYCNYPEGQCWCGIDVPCSGMVRPDDWYAKQPNVWQCTPTPPAVRADGCPGVEPSGACATEGQSCMYGDCCVREVHCDHGQWATGMASCPP